LKKEADGYQPIPPVRVINAGIVQRNYLTIKQDVREIIEEIFERLLNDPAKAHMVIRKAK